MMIPELLKPKPITRKSVPGDRPYEEKYRKLSPMSKHTGLKNCFGNGVANHARPLVTREARELLPGMFSFDPLVRQFLRKLSDDLNAEFPIDLDDNKFTRTGIHTSFDRLRTVAGYMMNPMSYTARDNAFYRDELELRRGYSPEERKIAEEVWHIVFSEWDPASLKITKNSAGGMRRNTSDWVWKYDFAIWLFEEQRFEKMLGYVDKNDWLSLANEFEMLFAMYIQKREQVDTPGKPRPVFDLMYALTNGKQGKKFDADKRVVIDGQEWEDFSATRARVVHAGPWVINCFLQIIATGHMMSLFRRFPSVFHVNTDEQISEVVNGKEVYAGDVKEYDRSMDKEALEVPHAVGSHYWDPRWMKASRQLFFSAYYARPLEEGGNRGVWVGDPRTMGDEVVCGNRSGHAWTSLIAKVNKFIETLFVFHKMGLKVLGNTRSYLEGNGAINVVNNGDDEVIHTESETLMRRFKTFREQPSVGHYLVSQEDGNVYSGKILRLTDTPRVYAPTPRIHTAFEKTYCPERSIGGLMRPYWWIGMAERINSRAAHPCGERAWEIHDRNFHDILAPHYGTMFNLLAIGERESPLNKEALTSIDREVLEDPDKIHYKFTDSEVSEDVLELVSSKIPFVKFEHLVKRYYRGHVH